jgi:uncharacterized protein (DUF111 family)
MAIPVRPVYCRRATGRDTSDTPDVPNVLRALILETPEAAAYPHIVDVLETNVDDVRGEVLACTIARLMESGAGTQARSPA